MMLELFYWAMMVVAGYGAFQQLLEVVKDFLEGDLFESIGDSILLFIYFCIHKWAFINLVPTQTLFH